MATAKKAAAKKAAAPKKDDPTAPAPEAQEPEAQEPEAQEPEAQEPEAQEPADDADDRGPAPARAQMLGDAPVFGRDGESRESTGAPVAAHESGATYADGTPVPETVDASTAAFSNGLNPVSGEKVGPTLDDPDASEDEADEAK